MYQTQQTLRSRFLFFDFVYAFIQFLGQTSILISLSALSITCITMMMVGKQPTWDMMVLPFLCTFCVYNFDRLADTETDLQSTPERVRLLKRYRYWLRFAVAVAFFCMVGLALTSGLLTLFITLAFPMAGVLYVLPIFRFGRIRRLKDVPLLKSFYVPACWCLLVVLAIHLGQVRWFQPGILFVFAFVYLRIFLGAIIGDIRDIEADRAAGIQTLAGFLGLARSYQMLNWLYILTFVFIVIVVYAAGIPYIALALIPSCLFGYLVFRLSCIQLQHGEFLANFYDFEYISYAPMLQIFYFL